MNEHPIKNIEFEKELDLSGLVEYQPGQVVSRTLAQNRSVSVTLFAFDDGEEISSHSSDGDALITVLEGTARITVGGGLHALSAGKSIVMPAGTPHAVAADGRFKMMLVVVFPQKHT